VGVNLFHQVGYIGQECKVACTLDSLSYTTLELERSSGDAAGQNFALLVEEFFEEFGILVVDIFDAATFETAIFLFLNVYRQGSEVADFRLSLCHWLVLLSFGYNFFFSSGFSGANAATLFGVLSGIFVETESEEANHTLVAAISGLKFSDD